MRNTFKTSILMLATVMSLSITRPAQSAVGLVTLNAPLVLGGVAAMFGGLIIFIPALGNRSGHATPFQTSGLIISTLGLIALEGEDQMSFTEVSLEEGQLIGLTLSEVESYNAEVDQVNALVQEVDVQLSSIEKPTLEDSKMAWNSLKDTVSPDTLSAIHKISVKALSK